MCCVAGARVWNIVQDVQEIVKCVNCWVRGEGAANGAQQMVSHSVLPIREHEARAWERVDCMKDSTYRRAVGGGEGCQCVWGASARGGSHEAHEGKRVGEGVHHHIGAPLVFLLGTSSRIVMFFKEVISGGMFGMESRETW